MATRDLISGILAKRINISAIDKNISIISLEQLAGKNQTDSIQMCPQDLDQPEQLYVNLSTFWYCFLALITTIGLIVSLISNMIIIYLFTW